MATLTESRIASKVKSMTKKMATLYEKANASPSDEWWHKFEEDLMQQLNARPIANVQIEAVCMAFYKRFEKELRCHSKSS